MDDEICLPMPPIEINSNKLQDIDELNVLVIQDTIYEMQDTILQLEIENKNLKTILDNKSQLIIDLQKSMINSEDYIDDETHDSYKEFFNYYKSNRDHIYRNLKNIMIKKGLFRNPRISEDAVNVHGMKLYNSMK